MVGGENKLYFAAKFINILKTVGDTTEVTIYE